MFKLFFMCLAAAPLDKNRILVGCLVAALCLMLMTRETWFLENTMKGQRLVRWFGQHRAPLVLRTLLLLGMVFGAMLAYGIIQPLQWK